MSWSLTREPAEHSSKTGAAQQVKHFQRLPSKLSACLHDSASADKSEKVESESLPPYSADTPPERNVPATANKDAIPHVTGNQKCSYDRSARTPQQTASTDSRCADDQRNNALRCGAPVSDVTKRVRELQTADQQTLHSMENSGTSENLRRGLKRRRPHTIEVPSSLHDNLPQTHRMPACSLQTTTEPEDGNIHRRSPQTDDNMRRFFPPAAVLPRATATSICTRSRGGRPWSAQTAQRGNESGAARNTRMSSTTRPHTVDAGLRMLRLRWQRNTRSGYHEYNNAPSPALRSSTLLASWLGAAPGAAAGETAAAEALAALAKPPTPTVAACRRRGELFEVQERPETVLTSTASARFVENDEPRREPRVVCGSGSLGLGLTAEALGRSGVALGMSGRITIVDQVR